MRKNKLLLLLALLMTAATGAWAQEQWDVVWDFTAWSTETVTALKADAAASKTEGWSDVEKAADAEAGADPTDATKDNCFWSCSGTVNADGNLSANGVVIKELKGLKFNSDYAAKRSLAIAVNYPSTSLGDYAGGAYLWLGGGGSKQNCPCFTIPGVKAGSKITIEVESNKTSSARGIGLYKNSYAAENLIGEQFTPTAKEAKTWDITEDCDVVVWNTSGCHIYTIKVKAPAAAPADYTVSLKDGVKDADKWTISPNPAPEGSPVTIQYTGRLKVKGVTATSEPAPTYPMASEATAADYGKVVCAAGHLHDAKTAVPTGCTAVALFAYIDGGNNRYGIALQDAENASWETITNNGANNNTLCGVPGTWTVTAPTDASWFVGTKAIYEAIFINLGSTTGDEDGTTYDANVNAFITAAGGTAISWLYSTTTEINEGESWDFGTDFWGYADKGNNYKVRPVLGFGGEAAEQSAKKATDLSTINANYTASDGETLTGTLASNVKISIADGATVTLDGVTINGVNDTNYEWAGITCLGDATIILSGTNTVKGFYEDYPGIQAVDGKTLIINGTGSLTASSYDYAAAIGGGNGVACGNIEIQGGTITATSGGLGAGIGGGYNASCGNITISGGTVNAEGGNNCAGIGGGYNASWGNITISGGAVTATGGQYGAGIGGGKRGPASFPCGNIIISGGTVTATGGENAAGIGGGRGNNNKNFGSCGTITITTGVTKVTATMGDGAVNSIGAGKYCNCGTVTIGGVEGAITTSPYTYEPSN